MSYEITNTANSLEGAIQQAADSLLTDTWFRGMDDEQLTSAALEWIEEVPNLSMEV